MLKKKNKSVFFAARPACLTKCIIPLQKVHVACERYKIMHAPGKCFFCMLLTNSFSKSFYAASVSCNLKKKTCSVFGNASEILQCSGYVMFLNCWNFHDFPVCLQCKIWAFLTKYCSNFITIFDTLNDIDLYIV